MAKKDYDYTAFGVHLKTQRKMKYEDIKSFAKATGIAYKDLYGYESGRTFPPIEKFIKICQCLDRSATYMLSPLLPLRETCQDMLLLFEDTDLKEMIRDKELSRIIQFTLFGFQILYQTKKHFNHEGDMIDYLNIVKEKLFDEGQLKKLR